MKVENKVSKKTKTSLSKKSKKSKKSTKKKSKKEESEEDNGLVDHTGLGLLKKPQTPARHWCITTHVTKNYKKWKTLDLNQSGIRYLVYQLESGDKKGTKHVQGYVEFYKPLRMKQVKDVLEDNTMHLEKRKGTRIQARDYCCKEDTRVPHTDTIHLGSFKTRQGHRTDVQQISDLILDGWSASQIALEFPTHYMRMHRGIEKLIQKRDQGLIGRHQKIQLDVLWGPSRSGKTRHVFDKHGPENVYVAQFTEDGKLWFDGYEGQKVLLINEFYGQMRTSYMQNLLDNYRMKLNVKGSYAISQWDKIYITSNCCPSEWYNSWESVPESVAESFYNRIDNIIRFRLPVKVEKKKWSWSDKARDMLPSGEVVEAIVLPSTTSVTVTDVAQDGPDPDSPVRCRPHPTLFDFDTLYSCDYS